MKTKNASVHCHVQYKDWIKMMNYSHVCFYEWLISHQRNNVVVLVLVLVRIMNNKTVGLFLETTIRHTDGILNGMPYGRWPIYHFPISIVWSVRWNVLFLLFRFWMTHNSMNCDDHNKTIGLNQVKMDKRVLMTVFIITMQH